MMLQADGLHPERRMAPRAAFETSAMVSIVNQRFKCLTRNLSPQGLALTGHRGSAPPGTFMRIEFRLPMESYPVGVDGVLVRAKPHSTGMIWGLRFIDTQPETQRKIQRYLEARVPEPSRFPQRTAQESKAAVMFPPKTIPLRPPDRATPAAPLRTATPAVPDAQVVQLYEDAMLRASERRLGAKAVERKKQKATRPSVRQQSKGPTSKGGTTDLDVELRWLYEQAVETKCS